jgi:hypothetical protein
MGAPGATVQVGIPDPMQQPDDVQDALELIGQLRSRLQPIALMRALGLTHAEIGSITGDSKLRVSQLASLANMAIGDMLTARQETVETSSPRARRLWELETDPPGWLTEHIGPLPRVSRKLGGQTETRRAWRRAAMPSTITGRPLARI